MPSLSTLLAPEFKPAVKRAFAQQPVILVVASLLLDGGIALRGTCIAAFGYWAAVLIIAFRRPLSPSKVDLAVIRWSFLPLALITVIIAYIVRSYGV